jgi:hypothetical protein
MGWLRVVVLMWLLIRIDDNWDLVIIDAHDTEDRCRAAQERSLWGPRVLCAPARPPDDPRGRVAQAASDRPRGRAAR